MSTRNETIFDLISQLLNHSQYEHQMAELIEPEKNSAFSVHLMIWLLSIVTYLLAIPVAVRMYRSRAYLNVVDYFSAHIVLCAFIAWIPAFILLLHQWFNVFTLRLCRLHYVLLSSNETVPLFFVLYMIIERFLYAYPSLKAKCTRLTHMSFIYLYAVFTWLLVMLIYSLVAPFDPRDSQSELGKLLVKYCSYNYRKLRLISTVRSLIYFVLFFPALVLVAFVLRYFYLMRGTNQIPPVEKLWTIRVTALLCALVFYDIYLYYLENIAETYKSFLTASLLHSTFYLIQLVIIICTEQFWLEFLTERCSCLLCCLPGVRRKVTTPVPIPSETEFNTVPFSSATGHYSLVDDTIDDEFDRATQGREPTLRVIV